MNKSLMILLLTILLTPHDASAFLLIGSAGRYEKRVVREACQKMAQGLTYNLTCDTVSQEELPTCPKVGGHI